MDDCREQQCMEIEALESMYVTDELRILCRDYPSICIELDVRPDVEEFAGLFGMELITLRATLPPEYPNCTPLIEFPDSHESDPSEFWEQNEAKIKENLDRVAEESTGMPMLFTLFNALHELLIQMTEEHVKNKDESERKKAEQTEREEQARFEGTRVTAESFKLWNKAFMEKIQKVKKMGDLKQEHQTANRLTGKQLFLADQSLNISDLQFLNSDKGGDDSIEIDKSLFEEELDFDSEADEDDEDYKPET